MRVLIAYATEHGSTREIAERIGRVLSQRGIEVEVRSAGEARVSMDYDAFVIGSAVHDQRWLVPARDLVDRCAADFQGRRVWLFSVGMPAALRWPLNRFADAEEAKLLRQFGHRLEPVAHRLFSGVIAPEHLPRAGRLAFRAIGGRYGDYRDWSAIEGSAASIADALTAGR